MLDQLDPNCYHLILFYGSPTEAAKSWCPVCVEAFEDFKNFAESSEGKARFIAVPVGERAELGRSQFTTKFPHLYSLPTLVIFGTVEYKGKKYNMPMAKVLETSFSVLTLCVL